MCAVRTGNFERIAPILRDYLSYFDGFHFFSVERRDESQMSAAKSVDLHRLVRPLAKVGKWIFDPSNLFHLCNLFFVIFGCLLAVLVMAVWFGIEILLDLWLLSICLLPNL